MDDPESMSCPQAWMIYVLFKEEMGRFRPKGFQKGLMSVQMSERTESIRRSRSSSGICPLPDVEYAWMKISASFFLAV